MSSNRRKQSKKMSGGSIRKRGRPRVESIEYDSDTTSDFKFRSSYFETHYRPIYGVKFAEALPGITQPMFATAGANRISVYKCMDNGDIKFLQCYQDSDANEEFYTCAWSIDIEAQNVLLAAAGARGIVRILSPNNAAYHKHLVGHTQAINEIKFHPKMHQLLLSASKDHSLRMWNVRTDVCIAIFGGVDGHRDEVLSTDFDILGERIVSSSMDHSVKVWRLNKPNLMATIFKSEVYKLSESSTQFETLLVFASDYSTRKLHSNYVDSVLWMGDFILSRQSCAKSIYCWTLPKSWETSPIEDRFVNVIKRFDYDESELWYIRFALDPKCKYLAVGHENGKIYIWNLDEPDLSIRRSVLSRRNCLRCVRQIAFSPNGKILIGVCEDGSIWRWDYTSSR